jgi:hypothetical protein
MGKTTTVEKIRVLLFFHPLTLKEKKKVAAGVILLLLVIFRKG